MQNHLTAEVERPVLTEVENIKIQRNWKASVVDVITAEMWKCLVKSLYEQINHSDTKSDANGLH